MQILWSLWQNRERNELHSGVWMAGVKIRSQGYRVFEVTAFFCGIHISTSKFMFVIACPQCDGIGLG